MSFVSQTVRITVPGVPAVPKPPAPRFHDASSKSDCVHAPAGATKAYAHSCGAVRESATSGALWLADSSVKGRRATPGPSHVILRSGALSALKYSSRTGTRPAGSEVVFLPA